MAWKRSRVRISPGPPKLNPNKTNTVGLWYECFHAAGEVTGVHVESKLWTPGLTIAGEASAIDSATRQRARASTSLLFGSVCRRGSQFLLCAPEQRVSGIIRRRGAPGATGLTGICDAQ